MARKFTPQEIEAFEYLCNDMVQYCDAALLKLRDVPKHQRLPQIVSQITYYRNAKSALRWAVGQARQRLKGDTHGQMEHNGSAG